MTAVAIPSQAMSITAAPGALIRPLMLPRRLEPWARQTSIKSAACVASKLGAGPPFRTRLMIGHTSTARRSSVAARFMIDTSSCSCMPLVKPRYSCTRCTAP